MDTQYYMSWVQIVVRFLIMRLLINTNLNIDDEDVILSSRDDGGQGTDKPLVERRERKAAGDVSFSRIVMEWFNIESVTSRTNNWATARTSFIPI